MPVVVIPFFSPITDEIWKSDLLATIARSGVIVLTANEIDRWRGERTTGKEHLVLFVGTGGTEEAIVDFVVNYHPSLDVLLLSHTHANSLAAALEVRAYLSDSGVRARIVHVATEKIADRLNEWSSFATVEERIGSCRLGIIGEPSSWLVASRVDPTAVRNGWGLSIVSIPMTELIRGVTDVSPAQADQHVSRMVRGASCSDRNEDDIQDAARVLKRVLEIVERQSLDAVTIQCFSLLTETEISGCLSLSALNDAGVTAGCEGDIPSTFTMLVIRLLVGNPSFMGNIADMDMSSNTITMAHCTVPTSMTSAYRMTSHFESGMSVALAGVFGEGDVTVVRISGSELSKYWVSDGRIVGNPTDDRSCRTQVLVKLESPVSSLLEGSLANHHILVLGHHTARIKEFLSFCRV